MRRLKRRGLSGEDLWFLGVGAAFLDRVRFRSGNLKLSDGGFFLTVVQWVVLKAEFWPWRLMHGYGERSLVSDFGFSAVLMMIVVDSGGDCTGSPFPVGGYGSVGGDGCCWSLFNGSDMTKSNGFFWCKYLVGYFRLDSGRVGYFCYYLLVVFGFLSCYDGEPYRDGCSPFSYCSYFTKSSYLGDNIWCVEVSSTLCLFSFFLL